MLTSLYIHIPFCNQICTYCDFHKEMAKDSKKQLYINALCKEIEHHSDKFNQLETIYIGGGTPSSLDLSLLEKLLNTIKHTIDLSIIKEYSIETNPNDLTIEFASLIKEYGINRVSVGVQTFNQKHLQFLGRTHNKNDVTSGIANLRNVGFNNISVDLIFSLINQTEDELEEDLLQVLDLNVEHISYYSLILEEKTKLFYLYEQDKVSINEEDLEGIMYNKVIDILTENGFNHYEISNFSKGAKESLHNKAYWLNREYLGLGSGSHSLLNNNRFANTRNITTYINQIEAHNYEQYDYYDVNTLADVLMLNLRLLKGIDIKNIELSYDVSLYKQYPKLKEFIKNELLEEIDGYLRFTTRGILLGNIVFQIFVEVWLC